MNQSNNNFKRKKVNIYVASHGIQDTELIENHIIEIHYN